MSLSRIRSASIGCLALILVLAIAPVFTAGPKFYPDDPLQREPESRDASGAKSSDIGLIYEIAMNLFAVPHHKPSNTRAHNANTVDEVPDSSWFTNRIGRMPLRAEDLARGPNVDRPPAPERWLIVAEKAERRQTRLYGPGCQRRHVVRSVRRQGPSPSVHRCCRSGDQDFLGAGLQPGADVHHHCRSQASRVRSEGHGQASLW